MSGLSGALGSAANTITAFENALNVTQNNISNVSTPGFSSQSALFLAEPFDPSGGPSGGVSFAGTRDSRNEYLEGFVQKQTSELGSAQQQATSLGALEPSFDISGTSGIAGGLSQLIQSFSALAANPNDVSARQQVINNANTLAQSFNDTATAVAQASSSADQQIRSVVGQINSIGAQIQQLNLQKQATPAPDANLDANIHAQLDALSQYTNFTTSFAPDGTVNVLIGGQTPLVLGATSYSLHNSLSPTNPAATYQSGTPPQAIYDQAGKDITSQITGGNLGGLLQVRNITIGGILGDTNQQGSLNQLASGFGDRVNQVLTAGNVSDGPPPVPGVALFQYDPVNPTAAAQSLSVTSITGSQIATIDPGPPYLANGTALTLGALATSTNPADQINGNTFTQFYGQVASGFGTTLSIAKSNQTTQTQSLAQANNLRSQASGVDLNAEAANLIAFQRSYEATAKLVATLSALTETTINMIQ